MGEALRESPSIAAASSYAAMLRASAARTPDGIAVVVDGEAKTYRQLLAAATVRARELKALRLAKGDAIGLLLPNSFEFIELLLGAALIGVVVVPINTRFRAIEVAHIIDDARLKVVFTTDRIDSHVNFKELLYAALPSLAVATDPWALTIPNFPSLSAVVHIGTSAPGCMIDHLTLVAAAEPITAPDPAEEPASEDIQLVMYTSGTTAKPKGCLMPNRCLVVTAALVVELFRLDGSDGWWCPLPMFHVGGLLFMTVSLTAGAKFIGMGRFDTDVAFEQFDRERPTVLYPLFPTIALQIVDHPRFATTSFDAVKYVIDVGPPEIQLRLQNAFPKALLLSAFGMTETTGIVTFNWVSDTLEERTTTVGHLLPGWSAMIVDPTTRKEVAAGQSGEIAVLGPGLFAGYLNNPQLTAQSFNERGYFHTGDCGALQEGGLLRYLGRLKDQLKVGGENVSALEVESFLATHPAVKLAQVVGIPDERYGEVPVAYIELAAGAEMTEQDVFSHCQGQIARFKIPRHVRFVAAWPMSATKIEKYKLRQSIIDELGLSPG